jgi:septum formation protein
MLEKLSGKRHRVITGFCVHDLRKDKEGLQAVSTEVRFKNLSPSEVEKYIAVGESMDKAGSYAIQGVGAYLVDSIVGSYTNVVGLPMCQVIEMMEEMGATDVLPY